MIRGDAGGTPSGPGRFACPRCHTTKSVPPGAQGTKLPRMRRPLPSTAWLLTLAIVFATGFATMGGTLGCAHQTSSVSIGPAQHFRSEATQIGGVKFEDDFIEARLVFQALPMGVPERAALRREPAALPARPGGRRCRPTSCDARCGISRTTTSTIASSSPSATRWPSSTRPRCGPPIRAPRSAPVAQDLLGRDGAPGARGPLAARRRQPGGARAGRAGHDRSDVARVARPAVRADPLDRGGGRLRRRRPASAARRPRPTCSRAPSPTGRRPRSRRRWTASTPNGSASSSRCCASRWAAANRRARRWAICCWRTATRCSARWSTSRRCTCAAD